MLSSELFFGCFDTSEDPNILNDAVRLVFVYSNIIHHESLQDV